jgi:hypothetical protein
MSAAAFMSWGREQDPNDTENPESANNFDVDQNREWTRMSANRNPFNRRLTPTKGDVESVLILASVRVRSRLNIRTLRTRLALQQFAG